MRVAIPIFGRDISPRFCFAREVLVIDLAAGRETGRMVLALGDAGYHERLQLLQSHGAFLLVCGGFDRAFLPEAERTGVHVIWGITGSVEAVLEDLIDGKIATRGHHADCWCHRKVDQGRAREPERVLRAARCGRGNCDRARGRRVRRLSA